jgi:hypothetical protein
VSIEWMIEQLGSSDWIEANAGGAMLYAALGWRQRLHLTWADDLQSIVPIEDIDLGGEG